MPTKLSRAEQLERLAAKQRKIQEQDRKLQARIRQLKVTESKEERRLDTRRKILLGSLVLAQVQEGRRSQAELTTELDAYLTEDRDRLLFGLPPRFTAVPESTGDPSSAEVNGPTARASDARSSESRDDRTAAHA